MKILALDLALKTGFAVMDGRQLLAHGVKIHEVKDWKADIRTFRDYSPSYPKNLMDAARSVADSAASLFAEHQPEIVVIEEVNIARARFSQKLIDFIHFAVIDALQHQVKLAFLTSRCWRDAVGAYATGDERRLNAKIGRLKRKRREEVTHRSDLSEEARANILKSGVKVEGKVIGRKKMKHFAIRVVEQEFGIKLMQKEDDVADALCLCLAAHRLIGGGREQS